MQATETDTFSQRPSGPQEPSECWGKDPGARTGVLSAPQSKCHPERVSGPAGAMDHAGLGGIPRDESSASLRGEGLLFV